MENEDEGQRGVKTVGRDGSETGLVLKKGKEKSTTGIGASLTPDYRDTEECNKNNSRAYA